MTSNVIPLLVNEDLIQEATDLIKSADIVGNNYFKVILKINDETNIQLFQLLEHRKIVGPIDENKNRKVLVRV